MISVFGRRHRSASENGDLPVITTSEDGASSLGLPTFKQKKWQEIARGLRYPPRVGWNKLVDHRFKLGFGLIRRSAIV